MLLLELNGITKLFGKLAALEDIDLKVEEGEVLGIVGPNGSGKTTMINIISGYYRPSRGTILCNGEKILGLRPDQIASRGIVRTFQSNVLFEGATVLESMIIGSFLQYKTKDWQSIVESKAYKDDHERVVGKVIELLKTYDIFNDIFLPAAGLSHGYQRMLGIAMALIANPKVLLLDEPTTGMNHEEAMFVVENIKKISEQGVTVVVIEHYKKVVFSLASRIALY